MPKTNKSKLRIKQVKAALAAVRKADALMVEVAMGQLDETTRGSLQEKVALGALYSCTAARSSLSALLDVLNDTQ